MDFNYGDLQGLFFGKKRKAKKSKWERHYRVMSANFRFYCMDLICAINDIDKDEFFFEDGLPSGNTEFKFNKRFKDFSVLDFKGSNQDLDSLKFRARFLTHLLFYMMRNMDGITKVFTKLTRKKAGDDPYMVRSDYFEDCLKRLNKFIVAFTAKDVNYQDEFKQLLPLILYGEESAKAHEIVKIYEMMSTYITEASSGKTEEYDEDVLIDNTIKTAYMLAVEDSNVKDCPKMKEGLTVRDRKGVKKQIRKLGKAIIKKRKENGMKKPTLYKFFGKSNPRYLTKHLDVNDDLCLNVGIKALMNLRFMLGSRASTKFINDLVMVC